MFSNMVRTIALSTTEAELYAAVLEAMDMMSAYYIMRGLKLTVELPMKLYVDNQGAVQLANNWSVGGRTRHVGTKTNYLRSLKEMGFLIILYKKGTELFLILELKMLPRRNILNKQINSCILRCLEKEKEFDLKVNE